MFTVTVHHYLVVSAILFSLGTIGVLTRRNAIVVFMCIELMLNAANLAFITFAQRLGRPEGVAIFLFVITIAAAEAAVGLALMIAFFKHKESIDVEDFNLLKW